MSYATSKIKVGFGKVNGLMEGLVEWLVRHSNRGREEKKKHSQDEIKEN